MTNRGFDGTSVTSTSATTSPIDWSTVRGAVVIGNQLFYGKSDSMLYKRSWNGATYGAEQAVNPYNDPAWDNVPFGCIGCGGDETYAGIKPDFYAQLPSVTAMAFDPSTRRLYYTRSGDSALYYRIFSPDSGVIYPEATQVTGVNLTGTSGLILSGTTLFIANGSTGTLSRVTLTSSGFSGSATPVSTPGVDWRAAALFTGP